MKLRYYPYTLQLKNQFTISSHSRNTTPAVIVEVEHIGLIGYGEASLPPYLVEEQSSVINFLKKISLDEFNDPFQINLILDYVNNIDTDNYAAKASVDIALHDLICKKNKIPLYQFLNIKRSENIFSSFTLGISDEASLKQKIEMASGYKFLKVKLGTKDDKKIISLIRTLTDKPLYIDVNQGWTDKYFALDMINWLAELNVVLIEQPLPKENLEDSIWLKEKSLLPVVADEAVKVIDDIENIANSFSGINVKLMKAGGIREAHRMILKAKSLNLKVMLGCMTETSCAITAASHLAALADWVDLDGAELISNDLFNGTKIINGRLLIPDLPGLGIEKIEEL